MKRSIVITAILLSFFPSTVYAYIDPGSGSALISIIVGAFVATGLAIKTFWYKITGIFTGKKSSKNSDSSND